MERPEKIVGCQLQTGQQLLTLEQATRLSRPCWALTEPGLDTSEINLKFTHPK